MIPLKVALVGVIGNHSAMFSDLLLKCFQISYI
jgi:hypothetical protein